MRLAWLLLPLLFAAAAPEGPKAPRPVDVLVQELGSKFGKNRAEAARELGLHGPDAAKAVPDLVRLLKDPLPAAREEAALSLARIDPSERAGLALVRTLAARGKDEVRNRAVDAIFLYPMDAEGVAETLLAELRGRETRFKPRALVRFKKWGAGALPFLRGLIEKDRRADIEELWSVLTECGVEEAPMFLPLLDHPSEGLRLKAADHLARCLKGKYPPAVALALEVIQEPKADAARVEEAVAAAAQAGAAAVPGLAGTLAHFPEAPIRIRAATALERIGPDARGAIPVLRVAAASFNTKVRDAALGAIWRIDPEAGKQPPRAGGLPPFLAARTGPAREKGVPPKSPQADSIATALDWLVRHQDRSGGWKSAAFEAMCRKNRCGGPGMDGFDAGLSALALMAFLGEGETHLTPRYGEAVRAGIQRLLSIQDEEGCVGTREIHHFTFNHALGTIALCEAYGLAGSPDLKVPAQNALNFAVSCQNPYMAWRYGVRPQDNDTAVTGWMALALWTGRSAGLEVDPACFEGAKAWLDKVTEPEYGRAGYTARGNGPSYYKEAGDAQAWPGDRTEGLTSQAVLTRILCGADREDEYVKKGADLCLKLLPVYDEAAGTNDFHYWHFGSLATFQVGGQHWTKWNEAMKKSIVDNQRRDKADDRHGSWDPVDRWSFAGGRIYATAINALTLQTPYRYPREWDRDRR